MKILHIKILSFFLVVVSNAFSATLIYNLRVAETTRRQASQNSSYNPFFAGAALVNQWSSLRNNTQQDYTGLLTTVSYSKKAAYMQASFAFAQVREKNKTTQNSRVQSDDILLMTGYCFILNQQSRITLSGMFGIPTHKNRSPLGMQFGTGHFGLGAQMDGSFFYTDDYKHAFLSAIRYVRFFPSNIYITINNQVKKFDFNISNAVDLLLAHNSTFGKNRFEFGYNPTFVFGARIIPPLDTFVQQSIFIRSNFFGSYQHFFSIRRMISGIELGLSYGFDHLPKARGSKRVISIWGAWGINF